MNRRCHPVLRTNLLGYDRSWNPLVYQMFGGSLGTSLDYPNLYRRPVGRQPEDLGRLGKRVGRPS